EVRGVVDADHLEKEEMKRRAKVVATASAKTDIERQLVLAADQFIVDRGEGKTVIAGYPWFSDWGRDTMIALPGLTLETNRPDVAKVILAEFAGHISEGMIPNRFPDEGDHPDYNTVDATLWFFEAVRAYAQKTEHFAFVRELYPKLTQIIDAHVAGTRYNIHVDTDGLLVAGGGTQNLTWMDAKIGDWVVTPRAGKAVEVQALWYNALLIAADFAEQFEDAGRAAQFRLMAATAKDSFNGQFWNADEECLFDVVSGEERDASVRPNQIFAASLHYTVLDQARARKVVERVATDLLTPVGLRSLSPRDSRYKSTYIGSPFERDSAYHQGTVWSWLLGPYVTAYRRVHAKDKKADKYVAELIAGLESHVSESCLGQVSEIFDADAPHTPRGAPAQAWSVGEILRVIKSDL
ncbi:MAG: glycogen debranching protein, partial [Blastocatellia bacterium]|nr:glycogen debranching protein [Blastocatellia bacterium]